MRIWSCKEKYWGILKNSLHSGQTKKDKSEESHSQQDPDYLYPAYKAEQKNKMFSSEKNIVDTLSRLVKKQSAPTIELDVFDGYPLSLY